MSIFSRLRPRQAIDWLRDDDEDATTAPAPRVETEVRPSTVADPSQPPTRRGTWDESALVNVDVTERVKHEIRAVTRPWNK